MLRLKYPGSRFKLINKGIPGDTADGGLYRLREDVIDYDPTRRWLIASAMGDIDPMVEIFWFGTRAFPEDMIYCIISEEEEISLLSDTVGRPRIDKILSLMERWKDNRVSKIDEVVLWRGVDLGSLKNFLIEHYTQKRDQRSQ